MPRSAERGAVLGCFHTGGRRPSGVFEEGSTSAASTSVGTGSPPSSASTSSPAFLDEVDPLYPDDAADAEADAGRLSTAIASHRFFLTPPGRSNSIVESAEHSAAAAAPAVASSRGGGDGSVSSTPTSRRAAAPSVGLALRAWEDDDDDDDAVRRVSVSTDAPRAEFLKSMVEMAHALELDPRHGADRARLHDLLLCYIALNDSAALRDILGAFTELLCLLNGNNGTGDGDGMAMRPAATVTAAAAERARHR